MTTFQERVNQAKQVSIVDLAINNGVEVTNISARYAKGVEHDSLVFDKQKNTFSWFSRDVNGDPINFMQSYLGVDNFKEAVDKILSGKANGNYQTVANKPVKPEPFQYYFRNSDSISAVKHYLHDIRGIDSEIITALHNKGLLQQDINQNAVFVWGRQGTPVGASVQGTQIDKEKFGKRGTAKYIGKNSLQDFGFNVSIGKPEKLILFEAPIDLLSYWTEHKDLKDTMLFSMDGLKERTVYNAMNYMYVAKNSLPTNGVYLGVDNDPAGHKFMDKFSGKAFEVGETGQEVAFQSLIPNDWDIPAHQLDDYQTIANQYEIEWQSLAAAHKATSNLTPDMQSANGYGYEGLLSDNPTNNKPQQTRSLEKELKEVAGLIKATSDAGQVNWNKVFQNDHFPESSLVIHQLAQKAESYYQMYTNQGARPVQNLTKDWNDDLIVKLNTQAEQRLLNTEYQSDRGSLKVTKKLQDNRQKYVAEQQAFNGAVQFFEADSPREMDFLIKNYGYNAVDKQDERVMGATRQHKQHQQTRSRALSR